MKYNYIGEVFPLRCTECQSVVGYCEEKADAQIKTVCFDCTKSQIMVATALRLHIKCEGAPLNETRMLYYKWLDHCRKWEYNVRVIVNRAVIEGDLPDELRSAQPKQCAGQ